MVDHLVLDLETVRTEEVSWEPKARQQVKHDVITPYGDHFLREPWMIEETNPFPPPPCHQIVCIGTMLLRDYIPQWTKCVGELPDPETVQLEKFIRYFETDKPRLVTWNGRRFDIPVLFWRASKPGKIGIRDGMMSYLSKVLVSHRFQQHEHIDLCDWLSAYGAAPMCSLQQAAECLGLGGKSEGMSGGSIASELEKEGGLERVRAYCLQDVWLTAGVFLVIEYQRGQINREKFDRAMVKLQEMKRKE